MLKKRYVVFVSSTYTDLIDERQAVSRALLRSNCFPSQMENWSAMDAAQMVAIKQLIDECDYYLVVTAGKYGSLDRESGLSYTEMEYDYALSIGKPVIRLMHRDPFNELRGDKIETKPKARRQLENFRSKLKTGSICSFWTSAEDLMLETTLALQDVIIRHPSDGWVQANTVDVAQEQRREAALLSELLKSIRSQNLDLKTALADLPVPLLRVCESGEVQEFNEAARVLIGDGLQEGVSLVDLMEGYGRHRSEWVSKAVETGSFTPSILRLSRTDRDTFAQVSILSTNYGDRSDFIVSLLDATELATLEGQFVQSQKMQATAQMASGIAHDFNNSLTAIAGHCSLLLLHYNKSDPQHSELKAIDHHVTRAAATVGQLLAFSSKQTLRAEEVCLQDTLTDLTHLLNRLVGEKVRFTIAQDSKVKSIRADKRQLEQIIMNLVVNARDAMPEGGEVKLETELLTFDKPSDLGSETMPAGKYICLRVMDEGVGIPKSDLQRVFEPFFSTKGSGIGMGLPTVYGTVHQMGGFVLLDSLQGVGTTVSVFFPVFNPN